MANEFMRPYEISIWTLQDSFLTVLKPYNLETKGQVQNPNMKLSNDGDNTFSFDIPMYLFEDGKYVENPGWFNLINGNLIVNLRKIKVIFNKTTSDEEVFEFLITKITETHENFEKTCSVECEGLAFHELGRQGYKIELSADVFDVDYEEWLNSENRASNPPTPNINYWCDKVLADSAWTYEFTMDYGDPSLESDKVYKDPFVSSWEILEDSTALIPNSITEATERLEIVEASESNRYNLIQTIAEQFQVYTKFVYEHDANYHITGRKVIFYNNFIADKEGAIDFTYAYGTKYLSREMDSTDLVSKMYVRPRTDSGLLTGEISITDCAANKSLEDYLLDFDYLYSIGTISEEQYASIKTLEKELHEQNSAIAAASRQIIELNNELPIQQAKAQTAADNIPNDIEGIAQGNELFNSITDGKGQVSVTEANPKAFYLLRDLDSDSTYYINAGVEGIESNSIHLYRTYNTTKKEFSDEITSFTIKKDEFGNITKITNLIKEGDAYKIYGTYTYVPNLHYENIKRVWTARYGKDLKDQEEAEEQIAKIEKDLKDQQQIIDNARAAKDKLIKNFEKLMGPALREGNWQPEDSYSDYKLTSLDKATLTNTSAFGSTLFSLGWDSELFSDEQENFYYQGIDEQKIYYPCIDLTNYIGLFADDDFRANGVFCYKDADYDSDDDPRGRQYFSFGSRCQFAFLRSGDKTKFVLMLTDVQAIDPSEFSKLKSRAWIGTVSTELKNNKIIYTYTKKIDEDTVKNLWIDTPSNYKIVYPRFQIDSLNFLSGDTDIALYSNGEELERYSDYYVNFRKEKYYITVKPDAILRKNTISDSISNNFQLNYSISNAAEAIYLDAIQVLKENSTPKVSYDITPSYINKDFVRTLYNKLNQLVHINDYELKFENVMGYISEISLDLDHPWEDRIVVKNYKTKFEDLFSTIVAQTEQMKKNSQLMSAVSNLFLDNGDLNSDYLQDGLFNAGFQRELSQNALLVAANLKAAAADNKAILAESNALKIINGDIGLAFPSGQGISNVILNRDQGLFIEGYLDSSKTKPAYFRVTHGAMGFFKTEGGTEKPMLYFDTKTGDLALAGTIYAKNGWFGDGENGWNIGEGEVHTDKYGKSLTFQGGLLYSQNERAFFSAGTDTSSPAFALYNTDNKPIFVFHDGNLEMRGKIYAEQGGTIGGWAIGDYALTSGSGVVGMSSTYSSDTNEVMFWAGNAVRGSAPFRVYGNGKIVATNAEITGNITAKSFILDSSASKIPQADISGLETSLSNLQESINKTKAVSGKIEYAISNSGTTTPLSWSSNLTKPTGEKPYLWTKTTITYANGNTSVAYSVSKEGKEILEINNLYCLRNSTNIPDKPIKKIDSDGTGPINWTLAVPKYIDNYYYFRCEQYEWSDGTITWSDPYIDYGITAANQNATAASKSAGTLANIFGYTMSTNGLTKDKIMGTTYSAALTSTQRLLIGANSGIDIWDTADGTGGSAVVLNKSGIALHGKTINLTTANATGTNVISLSDSGITLASSASLALGSGSSMVSISNSGISMSGKSITLGTGNFSTKGFSIEGGFITNFKQKWTPVWGMRYEVLKGDKDEGHFADRFINGVSTELRYSKKIEKDDGVPNSPQFYGLGGDSYLKECQIGDLIYLQGTALVLGMEDMGGYNSNLSGASGRYVGKLSYNRVGGMIYTWGTWGGYGGTGGYCQFSIAPSGSGGHIFIEHMYSYDGSDVSWTDSGALWAHISTSFWSSKFEG